MYFKSNFYRYFRNIFLIISVIVGPFDSSTVNYYGYLELCDFDQCYSFFMNATYNNETRNALFSCSPPVPLDEEETLATANVELSYPFVFTKNRSLCNESSLLLENVTFIPTHKVYLYLTSFYPYAYSSRPRLQYILKFDKTAQLIADGYKFEFNESQRNCSSFDRNNQRACFCATEEYAKSFCTTYRSQKFEPELYSTGEQYYHLFGNWTTDRFYHEYYFKMQTNSITVLASLWCRPASLFINGKNQSDIHFAYGTNSTPSRPEEMEFLYANVCKNDVYFLNMKKSRSNFTVYVSNDTNTNEESIWHPLLLFDWLKWPKLYKPGECFYESQVLQGDIQRQFCICMRRNVTEKFCKGTFGQKPTKGLSEVTTKSTSDDPQTFSYDASTETSITHSVSGLNFDDNLNTSNLENICDTIETISQQKNISEEVVTSVLTKLDVLLSKASMNITPSMASRLLASLNSLTKNSASDINFKDGKSFAVRRKGVNCSVADTAQEWPIMNDVVWDPENLAADQNHARLSIEIPRETVCNESEKQEFKIVYYMFHNQALFSTNDNDRNPCESSIHIPKHASVVSATLLKKWNMEEVHRLPDYGEDKIMARIMYPAESVVNTLHGSIKLAYWTGTSWVNSDFAEMSILGNYYQYDIGHLTDFTLIVDGLEMDPILCNAVLNQFSITLNFASFSGLLVIIACMMAKWLIPNRNYWDKVRRKRVNQREDRIRFVHYVTLALFHICFGMFVDSRDLFWPISCEIAAMMNYALLLGCICITTLQFMNTVNIDIRRPLLERIIHCVTGKKFIILIGIGGPIISVILLSVFMPEFFIRQDSFCWIRPDYLVPAVVVPLSLVVFTAMIGIVKIAMRTMPQEKVSGVSYQASVATVSIISSSSSDKVDESSISNSEKTARNCFNKMILLFCMQLMLGAPWICQYLALSAPHLVVSHYIFTLTIGSQGLLLFVLFCYRKLNIYCFEYFHSKSL